MGRVVSPGQNRKDHCRDQHNVRINPGESGATDAQRRMSFKELNSIACCREVYRGLKSRLVKVSGELAGSRLSV